jgi:putative transposase
MRFQFIDGHHDEFAVGLMCKALAVSPSGYYAWRGRPPSTREMANRELKATIRGILDASSQTYGSPRIYQVMRKLGLMCSRNRVARLMRAEGLRARQRRRFRSTTKRNESHRPASNLLRRDFGAARPDQKWLADITYIPTSEGWLYLAAILDLFGRRVVGWAMDERMTTDLTLRALKMALRQRRPGPGLIHHSDQGSQYTDGRYQALLATRGIEASMNGAGTWYDNAPMESFFGTLKSERVHHIVYRNRDEATTDLFRYIEGWYNRWRLHSSLAYESPEAFEQLYRERHEIGLTPSPQKQGKVNLGDPTHAALGRRRHVLSHRPLWSSPRAASMRVAPFELQDCPPRFIRHWTTFFAPLSTVPLPIGRPSARKRA